MSTHLVILAGVLFLEMMILGTYAMTPEQKAMIHEHFEELGMECLKDIAITEKDINDLRAKNIPTGENVPCFLACVMKKVGIMDGTGMLQKENALELAKKIFKDEEELAVMHDYLHSCAPEFIFYNYLHVNSEQVNDGEKGCERAMKAYKCMLDNASQFGIDL